jgi:hypothetical protein
MNQRWKLLEIPRDNADAWTTAVRLNALGSLLFFLCFILKKHRLVRLHAEMCHSLETEDLHLVFEIPVGHFKSTIGAEGLSLWWSLPFTEMDEHLMRELGYGDEWIRWMKHAHNPNARTLITHAIESRAIAMGKAVDHAYRDNDTFRAVFHDILPDNETTWNDHTKFQKRRKDINTDPSTGTYEYRGVGSALQGLHVSGIINDDTVGRDAQRNVLQGDGEVMQATIDWWKQTTTRFDPESFTQSGVGRQLVIGNRWAHTDLNSWIREHMPDFKFETHSAEGGCCKRHPAGEPIFPEEYSAAKLMDLKRTLGSYFYSHMYLNYSLLPEECIFRAEWIRKFRFKPSRPELPLDDIRNVLMVEHTVQNGETINDIACGELQMRMLVDLAHAKKRKRCKHVVLVIGLHPETDRFYLLDLWAEGAPYSSLVDKMYDMAEKWGMSEVFLETVAAQNLLKFHLEQMNEIRRTEGKRTLYVQELDYDNSENAKKNRIESMEPIYKNGQFFVHPAHKDFYAEYDVYPASATIDVLDTIGYAPQTFQVIRRRELMEMAMRQQQEFKERRVGMAGY